MNQNMQSVYPMVQRVGFEPTAYHDYLLQHIREVTAKTYVKRLSRMSRVGNLDNTEQIKNLICTFQSTEAYKELLTNAYDHYVRFKGLSWSKPHFTRQDVPLFIALESELDLLINKATLKLSVYLELLKETGADSGEAWKLRWIDINADSRTVSITPTKNHNTRTLPISSHLLSRLLRLPRSSTLVFGNLDLDDFRTGYIKMRNQLAAKMANPRLQQIALRSFRHWKATTEYAKTKDILHVKWLLGHKRIENTLVYTHLIHFESDEYTCKVAHTLEEATALIEAGYEYITDMDNTKIFRRRK
jgi:integrase